MIQIVYGSVGGNTEFVCNLLAEKLVSKNMSVKLSRAKVNSFSDLDVASLYVFASPTYGHGQLEKYMAKFLKSFKNSSFDFKGKNFAVIGLGDKKYDDDYFIESAKILEDFVRSNGGELLCEPLKIAGCVYQDVDEKVTSYCKNILKKLNE
jgi:flavodoxin